MKKLFSILFFLAVSLALAAQIENSISGSLSLAGTSVADTRHWTAFHNPAALGYKEQTELGAAFENRYFIAELSTKIVQAAIATPQINIGLSLSHFGYSVYHDILAGAALARNFGDRFSLGVQVNYFTSYFTEVNRYRGALTGGVGATVKITPKFALALSAFNPFLVQIKTETYRKKIPSVFSAGTSLEITENLFWRTQADKDLSADYRFATAFDYDFANVFRLKIGAYGYQYFIPSLGAGFSAGGFHFDLHADLHPVLGVNTFAMLRYGF